MTMLFAGLALFVALQDLAEGPPLPTKEQLAIVEKMGDNNYKIREKAMRDLEKMGRKSLCALELATKHKDIEIVRRAKLVLEKYYNFYSKDVSSRPWASMASIWYLDNKLRWPYGENGLDIAKYYYIKARDRHNQGQVSKIRIWTNPTIAEEATRLYIKDMIWKGLTRKKAIKRLNDMALNETTKHNEYEGSKWGHNEDGEWQQLNPPGKLVPNYVYK